MRTTVLTSLFVLLLAACSPSGDSSTTTASNNTTTPADSTTVQATSTTAPEATTTTELTAGGGPDCLVGTWSLDTEAFIATMSTIFAQEGFAGEVAANDGEYLVTMNADGTLMAERDNWGFSVDTDEGTFILTVNGTEEGTWSADDSSITVTMTTSNVTSQTQVEIDGQLVTMPQSPVDVPNAVAENSTYSCDGDTLTVVTDEIEIVMNKA